MVKSVSLVPAVSLLMTTALADGRLILGNHSPPPVSIMPGSFPVEMSYQKRIQSIVSSAAEVAKSNAGIAVPQGINIDWRLYYKPCTAIEDGALLLCSMGREPQGYVLACNDRFTGAIPYDHYFTWIRVRIGRLPLLAPC